MTMTNAVLQVKKFQGEAQTNQRRAIMPTSLPINPNTNIRNKWLKYLRPRKKKKKMKK